MDFTEHLKSFLGPDLGDEEARAIGATVIAANVRGLKVAVAERVWQARLSSASGDHRSAAAHLSEARSLKARYEMALAEYARLRDGVLREPQGSGMSVDNRATGTEEAA